MKKIKKTNNKNSHPLVNMFFTVLKNGKPNHQGLVIRKIDKEHFMVRYFSYLDGHLMEGEEIASFEEMKKWKFFETPREMREMHYKLNHWDEGSIRANEWMAKKYEGSSYNEW
ncbi:MAG: hypothetical protein R6V40_01430 [Candidatus Moraniibacteriota bacterium]